MRFCRCSYTLNYRLLRIGEPSAIAAFARVPLFRCGEIKLCSDEARDENMDAVTR